MYRKKVNYKSIILLVLISIVMTGCMKSAEDNTLKVRIACFPNLTHSQALLGMAGGDFQKALGDQAKIEWKTFNAGPAEMEAIFAGEVDIGYIGPVPAINGYVKSKGEVKIIAGATNAGSVLVSRKGLAIKSIKELDGKKVAVPQFGNTQDLVLRVILTENGLKDSTKGGSIQIVQAENPDIKTLLDGGQIDAALVPEPWGTRLIKEVGANVVLDYNQVYNQGGYSSAVVVARTDFIKNHPDIVKKIIKKHVELTRYINKNADKEKHIINAQINKLTKSSLKDDILDASFKRLIVTNNPEKESIASFIKVSKELGVITEQPDVNEILNIDILNEVLKESGQKPN